ncbi:MAG: BatA domain-containing protein [Myxococcales bacterium]
MLWGTSLAALPLLVHLFNRKRARPHPFAAIDFVLRSRRRTARRLRLKRLILFLVRTLFLLALPVALARPQPKKEQAAAKPQGPAATAIVLDTSLSMAYELDGKRLLERARGMAKDALSSLAAEDPVTLVTCEPDAPLPKAPGFDRASVREGIDRAAQTLLPQDMTACLGRAARALGESTLPAKRIILATDLTAAGFRLDVPAPTIPTPQGEVRPEVVLLDAAGGAAELPNAAVVALKVEAAPSVGHRAFQFTATVANHSRTPLKDATAVLKVGKDTVAKAFVDVPARGTAVKTLTYRFPAGGVFTGEIQLSHDALPVDDVRHFAVKVPRDVKALVVDGAPNPVRFMDEAFFVQTALESPGSPVRPTLRDAETAANENFADYDVFLLLNVRSLPPLKVKEALRADPPGRGALPLAGRPGRRGRLQRALRRAAPAPAAPGQDRGQPGPGGRGAEGGAARPGDVRAPGLLGVHRRGARGHARLPHLPVLPARPRRRGAGDHARQLRRRRPGAARGAARERARRPLHLLGRPHLDRLADPHELLAGDAAADRVDRRSARREGPGAGARRPGQGARAAAGDGAVGAQGRRPRRPGRGAGEGGGRGGRKARGEEPDAARDVRSQRRRHRAARADLRGERRSARERSLAAR